MQLVFSLSQLQYFQFSTVVKLYQKNKETQKFCLLAPIFNLAQYLIFTATSKSIIPESLVLVTKNEQFGVKSAHIRTTISGFELRAAIDIAKKMAACRFYRDPLRA